MSSTENATLNQEFISFLECYRLDNYSEALLRHYLNEMEHSYLPPQTSSITQNGKNSPAEVKMMTKQI